MSERVTWILSVKDGMPYLTETLASIEAQTYSDWEVCAWVNGSSDGTLEELQRWIPSRLPGRIVSDRPSNYGDAVGTMIREAQTELCALIHADDVNAPERLERQVAFMQEHPEIALVGSRYDTIDSDSRPVPGGGPGHGYSGHDDIVHMMMMESPLGCPTVLFRRSAVLEAGNHRHVPFVEDYDLWMRLAVRHKIASLNEFLLHYRVHPGSATVWASAANLVRPAAHANFARNALPLYGLSEAEALRLREQRHPFALAPLLRVARHLSQTQGGTALGRFFSHSFVQGSRGLIKPADLLSRVPLTVLAYRSSPGRFFSLLRSRLAARLRRYASDLL